MHILTFDIEGWYHLYPKAYRYLSRQKDPYPFSLERETRRIFRFLEERNIRATFFWLGEDAERHTSLVRELHASGHEIGVHSFTHLKIGEMDKDNFKISTERAVKTLEDITGEKIKSYRAPNFSLTEEDLWALEVLKDLGIERDCSTIAGSRFGNMVLPSAPFFVKNNGIVIKEFPISSIPVLRHNFKYAGSGYFRITPYKYLYHKMTTSPYVMSYFHPRDFDKLIHKKIKKNPYLKIKYRIGAGRAFRNLDKLSELIPWIPLQEAENKVNWDKIEVIEI